MLPALSMQSTSSKITLIVAYLVTLPLACIFAFTLKYSVICLVLGIATGHALQSLLYWVAVLRADWDKISEEVAERIKEDHAKQEELN